MRQLKMPSMCNAILSHSSWGFVGICAHAATSGVVSSALCLARQWIQARGCFCAYFTHFLRADGDSGPGIDSRPSLLALLNGEVCAADASVAPRGFLVNFDLEVDFVLLSVVVIGAVFPSRCLGCICAWIPRHYFHELLVSGSHFFGDWVDMPVVLQRQVLWFRQRRTMLAVHRCSSWTRPLTCPLVCYDWRDGPDSAENCLEVHRCIAEQIVVYQHHRSW